VVNSERAQIERLLDRPVADATKAVWGFTNRTDIVTLADGDRVVVQRYRRRQDAEYRLRVMRALWTPAAEAGIAIPRIRESDLDADPAWVIFDVLPGVPVPAADAGLEGPRFPAIARSMGELLAAFRRLPSAGLELDDLWAKPGRLAARGARWAEEIPDLTAAESTELDGLVDRLPALFANRPVALAHGDFAPVNVLTDGVSVTGLLDFESVRLADPLFDVAWWAWAVGFSSPSVLEEAWPAFLHGAGIDATDPELPARIRSLQVLRMLELLVGETDLGADVQRILADRLRGMLSRLSASRS
jgi:aminoglycoside phosphotransferase (APT) family kinase protein